MVKVLFVCMGNICRSPTAEGVFRSVVEEAKLLHRIEIDSAGTHAYHIGEPPDQRSQQAALRRGIDLSSQRARKVKSSDFEYYDYVLAMDRDNLRNLTALCTEEHSHKLQLFLDYAAHMNEAEVPDPYYGGSQGFERVLDLIDAASRGLLEHISEKHKN